MARELIQLQGELFHVMGIVATWGYLQLWADAKIPWCSFHFSPLLHAWNLVILA